MGGDHHARWLQHRDATDMMNAVMDPNGEPAAVNVPCLGRRRDAPSLVGVQTVCVDGGTFLALPMYPVPRQTVKGVRDHVPVRNVASE